MQCLNSDVYVSRLGCMFFLSFCKKYSFFIMLCLYRRKRFKNKNKKKNVATLHFNSIQEYQPFISLIYVCRGGTFFYFTILFIRPEMNGFYNIFEFLCSTGIFF
jgi:hypothetical protein